ncbi:MAG: hypothetical protein FWF91_07690 [Coriobacteriia bacterium]|nr:hypothetical protein [Coriobacteriia bacterium]
MQQLSERDARRLADAWAEREGKALAAEVEAMRQQGVDYLLPRANRTVRELGARGATAESVASPGYTSKSAARDTAAHTRRRAERRRAPAIISFAAAACFIVIALIVGVPSLLQPPSQTSPGDTVVEKPPAIQDAQMIPVSFGLPADYRLATSDYDNGVSLYTLESPSYGEVKLAMYHVDGQGGNTEVTTPIGSASVGAMDEVLIDGTAVPAKIADTYVLLAFQQDDVHYTLTSRDNLGALAALYRCIVGTTA